MIDTTVVGSPGWWLVRLSGRLAGDQTRLTKLRAYYRGEPPLPEGAQNQRSAYQAFQRKSRLNLAELACEAVRDRMTVTGLRTTVDAERTGDQEAWRTWRTLGLDMVFADALEDMLSVGRGIVLAGRDDTGPTPRTVVTREDPEFFAYELDPTDPNRVVAALKSTHNALRNRQEVFLYLPGQVWVATTASTAQGKPAVYSGGIGWDWDEDQSGLLPAGFERDVPVFVFVNRGGVGEFERHTDVLDRINHMILQRMMIVTAQAFRQRALKGDLPDVYPEDHALAGQTIDYDAIFVADPGALWMVPENVEIWESGQADIGPILLAVRDDIVHFAAVTRTPMAMLAPDSQNQTAEGATYAREGLVFRGEDRIMRVSHTARHLMSFVFRLAGDEERADLGGIELLWAPLERRSLGERADAASKAVNDMPVEARLIEIWQLTPLLAAQYAAQMREEAEQDPVLLAARDLAAPLPPNAAT